MDDLEKETSQISQEHDLPEEYVVDAHAAEWQEPFRQWAESNYGEQVVL